MANEFDGYEVDWSAYKPVAATYKTIDGRVYGQFGSQWHPEVKPGEYDFSTPADPEVAKRLAAAPDMPQMTANEPSLLEEGIGAIKSGFERGRSFLASALPDPVMGGIENEEVARGLGYDSVEHARRAEKAGVITEANKQAEREDRTSMATDEAMREIHDAQGWMASTRAIAKNPRAVGMTVASSLGTAASVLAASAASGPLVPLVAGLGSGSIEYGSTLQDTMAAAGVDMTDPGQVTRALGDEALMAEARRRAEARGLAVGTFDALTAGLAGRLLGGARSTAGAVGRAGGEAGIQAGGGMAGEAAGQLAADGKITSTSDVVMEGIAEIPSGIAEGRSNYRAARQAMAESVVDRVTGDQPADTSITVEPQTPEAITPTAEKPRITAAEVAARRDARLAEVEAGAKAPGAAVAEDALDTARAARNVALDAPERAVEAQAAAAPAAAIAQEAKPADAQPAPSKPVSAAQVATVAGLTELKQQQLARSRDKTLPKEQRAVARKEAQLTQAKIEAELMSPVERQVESAATGLLDSVAAQSAIEPGAVAPTAATPATTPVATDPLMIPPGQTAPAQEAAPQPMLPTPPPAKMVRVENEQDKQQVAQTLSQYGVRTDPSQVEVLEMEPATQRVVNRMSKLLGRKVIFYRANTVGSEVGGFAADAKRIFVNADNVEQGDFGVRAIIGHEFLHTLRMGNKKLFDELFEFARPRLRKDSMHFKNLTEGYAKAYGDTMQGSQLNDAIEEEALADYVGDLLNDDTFWNELAEDNPSLFKRMLDDLIAFIDKMMAKAQRMQADDVYTELTAMRAKARDIMSRHIEQTAETNKYADLDPVDATITEYEDLLNQHESDPDLRAAGLAEVAQARQSRDPALIEEIKTYGLPDLRKRAGGGRAKLATKEEVETERRSKWDEFKRSESAAAATKLEQKDYVGAARTAANISDSRIPDMPIDTQEKEAFYKDVPVSQRGRVYAHGTARDITKFKPKQGDAVFGTPSTDFAAPYMGSSAHYVEKEGKGGDVRVGGVSMKRVRDNNAFGTVENLYALMMLKHRGDTDAAITDIEDDGMVTNGEDSITISDTFESDEVIQLLQDIGQQIKEGKLKLDSSVPDPNGERAPGAGMNITPFVTNASNVFDYDNKAHTKRLIEAIHERYPTLGALNAASKSGDPSYSDIYDSWQEFEQRVRRGDWTTIENKGIGVPTMLREMGFDGYHVEEEGTKNIAVMDPKKVKSAYGNVGAFGTRPPTAEEAASLGMTLEEAIAAQESGDIRLKLNLQQVMGSAFVSSKTAKLKEAAAQFERWFVDEFRDLREVQNSISKQLFGVMPAKLTGANKALFDRMNAWRKENLRHGAFQDARKRAENKFIEPMSRVLGRAGISLDEFSDYLWWRHAPERDAYLRERASADALQQAGADGFAGISPADARANIAALSPEKRRMMERAAKFIDGMRQYTLDTLRDSGQITDEHYDSLLNQYDHYVPLRGIDNEIEHRMNGGPAGLSMNENPIGKRAMGRKSKPKNIIEEMVGDMENGLVGGQKQVVLSALVRLIAANPDPNLWAINPVTSERKWVDGQVRVVQKNGESKDQITFMHRGVPVSIEIRHDKLRTALLALDGVNLPKFIRFVGRMTRWLSAVKTSFSPFFLLVNPVRDGALATMAVGAEHGLGTLRSMAEFYPHTYGALVKDAKKNPSQAGSAIQRKLQQYAREFGASGGKTGYTYVADINEQQSKLRSLIDRNAKTPGMKNLVENGVLSKDGALLGRKVWSGIANTFEIVNEMAENSTRLAVFAAMREKGLSVDEAAAYAKEVTVNFNRRGAIGKHLNTVYMFFNAAMQGSVRLVKLHKNPKFAATMGGLFAASYALALAQMVAAGDDDDGESLYEKAAGDRMNQRTMPIYLGDGRTLPLPVPYGPNIYTYAGYRLAKATYDAMRGRPVDNGKVAGDIAGQMLTSMSPIDPGKGGTAFLPEIARIPAQSMLNQNDFGGKIAPKIDPYDRTGNPLFYDTDVKTGGAYKFMARALNTLTGGDDYDGGWVNLTGEQVRHFSEQATGGMGRMVSESYELAENLLAGVDIEPSDIPLANVYFRGKAPEYQTAGTYYDNLADYDNSVADWKLALARNDEAKLQEILKRAPWIEGAELSASTKEGKEVQAGSVMEAKRQTDRELKGLRRAKDALYADETLTTSERIRRAREIDVQIEQVQRQFNTAINAGRGF